MRTFCFHENIAGEYFILMRTSHENTYLMQTFVENKFVLIRVFVQTTWMKMFADVRGPLNKVSASLKNIYQNNSI